MAYIKRPEEPKKGAPAFMTTYADLVTLLLCFFVMLYSMSSIDIEKFKKVTNSYVGVTIVAPNSDNQSLGEGTGYIVGEGTGYIIGSESENGIIAQTENTVSHQEETAMQQEIDRMTNEFQTYMLQNEATTNIEVENMVEYMRIRFPEQLLFDSGAADLKPEAVQVLNIISDELLKYPNQEIRVEGHTDNVPMRNQRFPDNFYLSSARADTVVLYLINEKGFDPKRLSSEGKSEYWPIASNDTPEGRALNRRVEIKVYASQSDMRQTFAE